MKMKVVTMALVAVMSLALVSCVSQRSVSRFAKTYEETTTPAGEWHNCNTCSGKGSCVKCNGTGKIDNGKCRACKGTGRCQSCDGQGGYRDN